MYPYLYVFGKTIGTYGLMMALAFLTVGILAIRSARRTHVSMEDVLIVGALAVGGALFVGRLLYLLVSYSASELWAFLLAGDLTFLAGGGIVFYGGLIGGVCGAFLGIRIARCSVQAIEYAIVPYIPLGHSIGRIGCLLAGCCHGAEYEGLFAVYYPNSVAGLPPDQGYFPIQIVEAVFNLMICACLLRSRNRAQRPFDLLCKYVVLYALTRCFLEFFRGDSVRGVYLGVSTSQWISMGLLTVCILRCIISKIKRA